MLPGSKPLRTQWVILLSKMHRIALFIRLQFLVNVQSYCAAAVSYSAVCVCVCVCVHALVVLLSFTS